MAIWQTQQCTFTNIYNLLLLISPPQILQNYVVSFSLFWRIGERYAWPYLLVIFTFISMRVCVWVCSFYAVVNLLILWQNSCHFWQVHLMASRCTCQGVDYSSCKLCMLSEESDDVVVIGNARTHACVFVCGKQLFTLKTSFKAVTCEKE